MLLNRISDLRQAMKYSLTSVPSGLIYIHKNGKHDRAKAGLVNWSSQSRSKQSTRKIVEKRRDMKWCNDANAAIERFHEVKADQHIMLPYPHFICEGPHVDESSILLYAGIVKMLRVDTVENVLHSAAYYVDIALRELRPRPGVGGMAGWIKNEWFLTAGPRSYTVDAAIADAKQCITTDPRSLLSDGTREAILTLIGKDLQQTAAAAEQDLQGFSDDGAPPAKQQKTEREFKRKQSSFVVEPPTIDGKMTQQNGELRRALEKIKPALAHVLECDAGYIAMPKSKMPLGAVRCATCVDQIRDLQRAFHNAGWTNGSGRAVDISEIPSPVSKLISGMRTQRSVAEYK